MTAPSSMSWTLPADAAILPVTRKRIIQQLATWDYRLEPVIDENLQLVASELMTNALQHAGGGAISVTLWAEDNEAYLEVQDNSLDKPCVSVSADEDEHGRGLFLVESLSIEWGTDLLMDGKRVWARMRLQLPKAQPSLSLRKHLAGIVCAASAPTVGLSPSRALTSA
ncbi:ATP-binding protein [Nonomuraea sp. NPDC059007]|uniref:ATP-binding protein n=1 Tax=Nonomuraea sp. NPDC059007 TaxID=3346692 RepID=UPI0036B42B8F